MFKRIALFLATNLAVLVLLGIVLSVLQNVFGISLGGNGGLLVMAAVFGFGGAFISLAMSKWVAKRMTGMQIVPPENPGGEAASWLMAVVKRQSEAAGIKLPEVGVYDAPEINAFATGPSRNNSLVAVSTGLLRAMSRDEAEAVIGHEISHVANGDMVTMTLIQGVMNTFVVFLSRVIGYAVDSFLSRGSERSGPGIGYYVSTIVLDILLGFLAAIIVAWFSRQREFRADAGSAQLLGRKQPMINALARLGGMVPGELPKGLQTAGITSGVGKLFSTHPPIEERIAALQAAQA
jgi:heat shock protein HtpX